ncbi:hypothetical protein EG328_007408 [Venturia inaequalis]|uniref:Lysine-specific metallo-endopeptidase domain-containing protein n=1 Tax=Venturia inaequalis TaxID=5025 RepID=A0A8H3VL25_VENIN|nr:hypothetical protein EG328_007408 [Venturia inaequalis]
MLSTAIRSAQSRAKLAKTALTDMLADPGKHAVTRDFAKLLFGDDLSVKVALSTYTKIGNLRLTDRLVKETKGQGRGDIIIFCDMATRIKEGTDRDEYYIDPAGPIKVSVAEYNMVVVEQKIFAATGNPERDEAGDSLGSSAINIVPKHLQRYQKRFEERRAALWYHANEQSIVNRFYKYNTNKEAERREKAKIEGGVFVQWPWINDLAKNMDSTVFHELTHTYACGRADDMRASGTDGSYGWTNALKIRSPRNADSLLIFANVVYLNTLGWTVEKDGTFHPSA